MVLFKLFHALLVASKQIPRTVSRCIHAGLLCAQESPTDRPTMLDVISMIYNEANQLPPPKRPAFSNRSMQGAVIEEHKQKNQENCSLNQVSITEMEAR